MSADVNGNQKNMNTINGDVCGNINEYDNFKCEYLKIKESDYDQYCGHSSYVSYCNLIKQEVPVCGWRGAIIIKYNVPYNAIPATAYRNNIENMYNFEGYDELVLIHKTKDKVFTLFNLQYVDIFETTELRNYNNFINISNRIDISNNEKFFRYERIH